MKSKEHCQRGSSFLGVLFTLVTIGLLAVVFLPKMARSRHGCCRISCTSNLKQIGLSYRLYANDHEDRFPFELSQESGGTLEFVKSPLVSQHFESMSNELVSPKVLVCPNDAGRSRAASFLVPLANSNISYFVGLGANETKPERLLSGDRNITGGVLLRNGSLRVLWPEAPADWTDEIHGAGKAHGGNIGLSDGSARQVTAKQLQWQLQTQDLAIVRLAIP